MASEPGTATGVRFGRTVIGTSVGDPLEEAVEGIVCLANPRGVLGAGGTSALRRLGGEDIEREAMARAPLEPGGAIATGAGRLGERGFRAVLHAVASRALGEPARLALLRLALPAALGAADERRVRSLVIPPLAAVATDGSQVGPDAAGAALVDEVVAYLRRSPSRIERIVFAFRFEDEAQTVAAALLEARRRLWVPPR
jgi:O-acetyl-ADP-ribose deacetylase (regulator of RNase III)